MLGEMEGVEAVATHVWAGGRGRVAPDARGGSVTEEAGADEHAGIVIEEEGGGADFDGDAGDNGVGLRGEHGLGGAQGGDGGAAAEADDVLEKGVGAETKIFRDVAGHAGAEVAGAGADEQGVELVGAQSGAGERGGEGAGGEFGRGESEGGVELVGRVVENVFDVGHGEVALRDATVAFEDGFEEEERTFRETLLRVGTGEDFQALRLGESGGGNGGGEGLEMHRQGISA